MRRRAFLVSERSKLMVKIRDIFTYESVKPSKGYGLFTRRGLEWLESLGLEPMDCYLKVRAIMKEEIRLLFKELRHMAADDQEVRLLMTIPGERKLDEAYQNETIFC